MENILRSILRREAPGICFKVSTQACSDGKIMETNPLPRKIFLENFLRLALQMGLQSPQIASMFVLYFLCNSWSAFGGPNWAPSEPQIGFECAFGASNLAPRFFLANLGCGQIGHWPLNFTSLTKVTLNTSKW